jgi:hypothetical protein
VVPGENVKNPGDVDNVNPLDTLSSDLHPWGGRVRPPSPRVKSTNCSLRAHAGHYGGWRFLSARARANGRDHCGRGRLRSWPCTSCTGRVREALRARRGAPCRWRGQRLSADRCRVSVLNQEAGVCADCPPGVRRA